MSKTFYPQHPRKRFGQHFLADKNIIAKIIRFIEPKIEDLVVEIGPGGGALTQALLPHLHQLIVIELDRDLIPYIETLATPEYSLIIYNEDALKFDLHSITQEQKSIRLVGNLPYNVATPLIFHFLTEKELIRDMHFMVQKEVAERLVAQPGGADYGRLSIMVQYHCLPKMLFNVKSQAFIPPPKVESTVIRLIPHEIPPYSVSDYTLFETVVRQAFSHRRKTLRNALKVLIGDKELASLDINPDLRPEQIKIYEYVKIADAIASKKNTR